MIQITDVETGIDITSGVNVHITMPGALPCPPGCKRIPDRPCLCTLSLFDVKGQMAEIFSRSDITKVANINSLGDWKFYKSPIFWVNVGLAFGFGLSVLLVITRLKNVCVFSRLINSKTGFSVVSALGVAFLVIIFLLCSLLDIKSTN